MKIPTNYRRLKPTEQLRKGDYYRHRHSNTVDMMNNDSTITAGYYSDYTFWRKRKKENASKPVNDKGLPLVGFTYINKGIASWRTVKVTKATPEYVEGFEQIADNPFKRFLRVKSEGIHLLTFNT